MVSFGSYYRPGISTYVWNKLFKREVLLEPQSMVDNRITIGEDAAVTYPAPELVGRASVSATVFPILHCTFDDDAVYASNSPGKFSVM